MSLHPILLILIWSKYYLHLLWLFGIGLIFSLVSQMGFFAYLTVHRFGLGIFKSVISVEWCSDCTHFICVI